VERVNLGLFDRPPSRREIQLALLIVGLQVAALLVALPFRDVRLPEVQSFVPMMDSITFVGELVISILLFAQAAVFGLRALTVLASGYLVGTLLLIPHASTFPGAFSERGLLGAGVSTTAWLAIFWWWSLPVAIIIYLFLSRPKAARPEAEARDGRIREGVVAAIALAASATLLAIVGHDLLPPLFVDRSEVAAALVFFNLVSVALPLVAILLLLTRRRSVLETWLTVVLAGYVLQAILNLEMGARFTFFWYANFASIVFSNLIVMVVLLAETTQMYARFALATAAKEREHEARLMSMDAVTAAMAHEVGQPLAALTMNTASSLNYLSREQPDTKRAIAALNDAVQAGRRTFAVIKNVRAMFSRSTEPLSEVRLNDLVRETTALLGGELSSQNITVQLALCEDLPAIFAVRVQIERLLLNLLTNAIEALGGTNHARRYVEIRTASVGSDRVALEVIDSGTGIAPERLEHIFDPFFTTKATGTGLGLYLSKAIVEELGGRMWATSGQPGAAFHIELPDNRM
jgi:signal transduction histidine kinase